MTAPIDKSGKDPETVDDGHAKDGVSPDSPKPGTDEGKKATPSNDDAGLKKALAATRKERDELQKQIRDGELAKLPELERYKSLSDELTKENKELKTTNMRQQVALELGLPWSLGKRIMGESLEDMREDASELAKNYKADKDSRKDPKNERTPTNDTAKTGKSGGLSMNDKLRLAAGRQV